MIEFALVLPLLFLLILNLVNFGAFIYAWITVANAARAGAQYMIMSHAWYGNPAEASDGAIRTLASNDAAGLWNATTNLHVYVCKNDRGTQEGSDCTVSVANWGLPTDPEPTLYVVGAVDVAYTYRPLIPFWDFPHLGIHLTLPPTMIHRRAVMRMVQ